MRRTIPRPILPMVTRDYDLCVIGGGPAGYAAAMRALDLNKSVVLIEKSKIGGTGIYHGALSSKTYWELSEKVRDVNSTLNATSFSKAAYCPSWEEVQQNVKEAIFERKTQYSTHQNLLQKSHKKPFKLIKGEARFLNAHDLSISTEKGEVHISASFVLIATGSSPFVPPNIEVDEETILTSNGIHQLKDYPTSLVILGAGVIGCEFATIFSNFGKTTVKLIDRADRILPFEDEDISNEVAQGLLSKGAVLHNEATFIRMEKVPQGVKYVLNTSQGEETHYAEKALVSTGRVANLSSLNLEAAGVELDEKGRYLKTHNTQTTCPTIYGAGDVTGKINLVNIAEMEGRFAVEDMFGYPKASLSYRNIGYIMFLTPEVAAVGLNEQNCIEQGIDARVVKLNYDGNPRAIAMRQTKGFFKILVSDDREMRILGMRVIGSHASSVIQAVSLLIKQQQGIEVLANLPHPHPSIIEGVQESLRLLLGTSVFKPEVFEDSLKLYAIRKGERVSLNRLDKTAAATTAQS